MLMKGQHLRDVGRHHGQVDGDAVALFDALRLQPIRLRAKLRTDEHIVIN